MLGFVIIAVTVVVILVVALIYLYPAPISSKISTVPGVDPTDPKEGNLPDILLAGGLANFLIQLHEKYGDIVSFWYGNHFTVSLASPELFEQATHLFDRPEVMFNFLRPVIGDNSIQFANGAEGRKRLQEYTRHFSRDAYQNYFDVFHEVAGDVVKKWSSFPKREHVPLNQYMMALAIKAINRASYGDYFDDRKIVEFRRLYDTVFNELELQQAGSVLQAGRDRKLKDSLAQMRNMVKEAIEYRQKTKSGDDSEIFVDVLSAKGNDEAIVDDAITFIIGGFHTTGNLLTWAIYFLATHKKCEDKLYDELVDVLGEDGSVTMESINRLRYTRQVLNETLRTSSLAFYACRVADVEIELGGHVIPKQTPIILALGLALKSDKHWTLPKRFDPDRFESDRKDFAFRPFGFAGKRICPGQRLAYVESSIVLAALCREFKFTLVEGQVVNPVYGFVTKPEDEIWIKLEKRTK